MDRPHAGQGSGPAGGVLRPARWALGRLREQWRALLAFEIAFRAVHAAVIVPMTGLALDGLIRMSGDAAVSNYDIAAYLLSPAGLLFAGVLTTFHVAFAFAEGGGILLLAIGPEPGSGRAPGAGWAAFGPMRRALPGFFRLGIRIFAAGLIAAVPFLGVVGAAWFGLLRESDINYYLSERPPRFWWAAGIIGLAAAGFAVVVAVVALRWLVAVPIALFEAAAPGVTLRESRRRMRGRRRMALVNLAGWAGFSLLLTVGAAGIGRLLEFVLFAAAGDRMKPLFLATAVSAGCGLLLAGAVSIVSRVVFWLLIGGLYRDSAPPGSAPALSSGARSARPGARLPIRRIRPWGIAAAGLAILAATTAFTIRSMSERINLDHEPLVTAHRGSSLTAPENTLSAVQQAIADGADYAEIDLQSTSDGHVVLCHDKDLRRIAGIRRNVADLTLDELQRIDAGSWFDAEFAGERIPTLGEVVDLARGRIQLNLELKFSGSGDPLADDVARILRETGFTQSAVLSSLSHPGLKTARSVLPEVPAGLIVTAALGDISRLGVEFLSIGAKSIDRDLIDRAHRAGLDVHAWTVNEPAEMLTMLHIGVDNIITDEPAVLVELLEERRALGPTEKTVLWLADFLEGRL